MLKVHVCLLQELLRVLQVLLLLGEHGEHVPLGAAHQVARRHFRGCAVSTLRHSHGPSNGLALFLHLLVVLKPFLLPLLTPLLLGAIDLHLKVALVFS